MNQTRIAVVGAIVTLLVVALLGALLLGQDASTSPPAPAERADAPDAPPGEATTSGDAARADGRPARRDDETARSGGVDDADARASAARDAGSSTPGARGGVLVDDSSRSAPAPPVAGTAGALDKEAVQRGIAAAKPKIVACYESALKVQPELMGRIVVEFKIEASPDGGGAVTSGEVADTDVASPFFEACVLKEVAGTPFDAPSGSGTVTVRYPFHFESDADGPGAQQDAGPG